MWKSIKAQLYILFSKKSTWAIWFLMLGAMAAHFIDHVIYYYGYDASYMYNPLRLIYLGGNNCGTVGFLFMQYYPLLIVLPASFAYFVDKKSRAIVFLQAGTDRKKYYISRSISTFTATFIIYALPLYMELALNVLAFPVSLNTSIDSDNISMLEELYTEHVQKYLFSDLWINNKLVYMLVMIALFGVVTGLLAVFAQCVSMVFRFKFAVFIFLPVYILLFAVEKIFGSIASIEWSANYFDYLYLADLSPGSSAAYIVFMSALAAVNILMIIYMIRKDEIV